MKVKGLTGDRVLRVLNCAVARQEKATSMVLFLSSIFIYLFNLLTPDSVCDIVRPGGGGGGGGGMENLCRQWIYMHLPRPSPPDK